MSELTIYMVSGVKRILTGDAAIDFKRKVDINSIAPIRIERDEIETTFYRDHIEMIEVWDSND